MIPDLEVFGPCAPAGRDIEPLELRYKPNSRQELDDAGIAGLKSYLESANLLEITRVLNQKMVILWVMDIKGIIHFAFEEIVHASNGEYLMPYVRENYAVEQLKDDIEKGVVGRLGHPSLLEGNREARIGGEIVLRLEDGDETLWKINRRSGRYGQRPHQTDEHLKAVHSLLTYKGLYLGLE
jgi:hypothetical protein